jgi:hypothetical protein
MRRAFVQLRLPRNPFLRLLLAVAGIALLSMFALAGAALAAVALAALGLRGLWWKLRGGAPATGPGRGAPADVIEGDYTVVERTRVQLPPRRQG